MGAAAVPPLTAIALLTATGGFAEAIPGLPTPGRAVSVGLPLIQASRDLAAAFTVGALVLVATCLPPDDPTQAKRLTGHRRHLVDLAGTCAALWAGLSLALAGFTYADLAGVGLGAPTFVREATFFTTSYELGRYLLTSAALALVVTVGALVARHIHTAGVLSVVALIGLWPLALTAHGAGTLRHDIAVDVQAAHLVGVSVWVGGLLGVWLVHSRLGEGLLPTVRRYSVLAGCCFVLVSLSGVIAAALRLNDWSALRSDYSLLLAVKVAALIVLGLFGLLQRRRSIVAMAASRPHALAKLIAVEAVVMLGATGAAVALNRTAPPAPSGGQPILTTAESILGYQMPGPLGVEEWFTAWQIDSFWLPIAALSVVLYVGGVVRLRRRGDGWPRYRTFSWLVGWMLFIWATNGAPGAYGRVLFSMHMVQHMTLATTVPVLLVLGAPVTLALRSLKRRSDGSMGPREWLLATVHAPLMRLVANPIVTGILFVGSLVVFYYSSLLGLSLETHTGHVLMTFHFLVVGYLFAGSLVGIDPGLRQPTYPLRVLMVMVTFGFHALFSVSLMASNQVLAEDWFYQLPRDWGRSLGDDQYLGASLGWALGDYPLALLAGVLVVLWVRADRRESARFDRQESRDGDAQLRSYNAYLGQLADARTDRSSDQRSDES
ncbi:MULTISPECIES: cytochrome c oxidase assembly protein [unclassified Nocardioides]|uniref:cytochrome c oxidase assembly protein n=1 Tax=unclassified Nocardioides TaxID=2615069 RepID=UPI0009F13666|nr:MULTISPECIES: cytochrome c oxidase assembly protein [unclassified Nocardioides]GAW49769.1 Copper resistance protein D family protein [Nocardioides sp. PD653-B2]GAW56491.1 Copper resistance protein D family protein [Nocardioides sp. PD653]